MVFICHSCVDTETLTKEVMYNALMNAEGDEGENNEVLHRMTSKHHGHCFNKFCACDCVSAFPDYDHDCPECVPSDYDTEGMEGMERK